MKPPPLGQELESVAMLMWFINPRAFLLERIRKY